MKFISMCAIICALFFLGGCKHESTEDDGVSKADSGINDVGKPVGQLEYTEIFRGDDYPYWGSGRNKLVRVLDSQVSYDELLASYLEDQSIQVNNEVDVDLENGQVVLVNMGSQSTGSITFEYLLVDEFEGHAVVNMAYYYPAGGCLGSTDIRRPYKAIYIPTLKDILFSESAVLKCMEDQPAPDYSPVEYSSSPVGHTSSLGALAMKQTKVFTAAYEYEEWLNTYPEGRIEGVNFNEGNVLFVGLGYKDAEGFSIEVTDVHEYHDYYVKAYVNISVPTCAASAGSSSPYQFVYIPLLRDAYIPLLEDVVIVEEKITYLECEQ